MSDTDEKPSFTAFRPFKLGETWAYYDKEGRLYRGYTSAGEAGKAIRDFIDPNSKPGE